MQNTQGVTGVNQWTQAVVKMYLFDQKNRTLYENHKTNTQEQDPTMELGAILLPEATKKEKRLIL
jgi:hypothetical protein